MSSGSTPAGNGRRPRHTAALSPQENERITDLFIDNVRRLDSGRPVRNRITAARRY